MAGGANQYSDMGGMQKAQQFAGKGKYGRAKEAWEAGGGDWTDQTHQGLQQLGGIGSGRLQQARAVVNGVKDTMTKRMVWVAY